MNKINEKFVEFSSPFFNSANSFFVSYDVFQRLGQGHYNVVRLKIMLKLSGCN
jgi:hypothetical protein